ncbi:MAG: hypothetical protein WDN76_04640 [Alphaproteobacteria bacterium]
MSVSRRRLLNSASALLIFGNLNAPTGDAAAELAKTWLARNAEHERLSLRWQQIESRLFKEHNWPKLTRTQRKRFPEKHEMDDLYDRMDALCDQNDILLAQLPTIVATTNLGIAGKLAVAALEVNADDNEEAHLLIVSILRDFRALHRA